MIDITMLTVGGILGLIVNVIIVAVILALTDRIVAHETSLKNSLIMAFVAYFVVPLALSYASIEYILSEYVVPLVAWILIGEFLLKGSRKTKLIVAAIAFAVYLILNIVGVPSMIAGIIPF